MHGHKVDQQKMSFDGVIFRRAFVDSLPVLMGYTTMGFVAGVLLAAKGNLLLSPVWAFLTSSLWVTGTMSIAGVPEIAHRSPALAIALMTLAVNFRYAFYGFTMLKRWKGVPLLRKAYLVMMLTDENYALEAACQIRDPAQNLRYCTVLSALNHSYWIVGVVLGAVVVCALGHVVDPERIRAWTNGMEFSMAALFLVIFTDQVRSMVKGGFKMRDEIIYMLCVVGACFAVNYGLRALPFLLFSGRDRELPQWAERFGSFLSPVIIAMLVVYSYSGLEWKTAWPYLAGVLTVGLQLWKRNPLASIVAGTVFYMVLL